MLDKEYHISWKNEAYRCQVTFPKRCDVEMWSSGWEDSNGWQPNWYIDEDIDNYQVQAFLKLDKYFGQLREDGVAAVGWWLRSQVEICEKDLAFEHLSSYQFLQSIKKIFFLLYFLFPKKGIYFIYDIDQVSN